MKKEGWKYIGLVILVLMLFGWGMMSVRPFIWLYATSEELTGEISVNGKKYTFEGDQALTINNIRKIEGFAIGPDGSKIFFDEEGANVEVDELGYLMGSAYGDEFGLIEFDYAKDKIVKIDEEGKFGGVVSAENGVLMQFSGYTDWRPFVVSEIKTVNEVVANVDSKTKLDAEILGLGGRKLEDIQLKYVSNNENVVVDEDGYIQVNEKGLYKDAVTVMAGDKEKAVTLQALVNIKLASVAPNIVTKGQSHSIKFAIDPKEAVKVDYDPNPIVGVKLTRGVSDTVNCGNVTDRNVADGTMTASCDFSNSGSGTWDVVLLMQEGEFVYLAQMNVVDPDKALNVSLVARLFQDGSPCNSTTISEDPNLGCNRVEYDLILDRPSYLKDKTLTTGNYVFEWKGQGPSNVCSQATIKKIVNDQEVTLPMIDVIHSAENKTGYDFANRDKIEGMFVIEKYKGNLPQGCDLVVTVKLTNLDYEGLKLNGEAQSRVNVKQAKQVFIKGDVLVQEGDLIIQRAHETTGLYTMTASGNVDVTGADAGSSGGYNINQEMAYDKLVTQIKENIRKLIIERSLTNIPDLSTFVEYQLNKYTSGDKEKSPEGRILYNADPIGDLILDNDPVINVCAPTTLVVEGRDVVIKKNIIMNPGVGDTCVEKGNFGLIVLDGNIYFDGEVENVEGFYFTTGTIYTGESSKGFKLTGVAVAHDYVLQRF